MSDATVVKSMADARETGLKVVMGSLEESRKSARIFIRVIYCLIVLAVVSFEMVTLVTEHRKEAIARQTEASQQSQQQVAPQAQQQLQQNVLARQPVLWLENGNSVRMRGAEGNIVKWYGRGFTSHCVYTDGRTEVHDENGVCGPGELDYQFVHVTTGSPNSITSEFVRR